MSGDSIDELRLDKTHWQCLRGPGSSLYKTYEALKAFFAGLTGLSKIHNSIMFYNCLYLILTDKTIRVSDRCLQEVIQDLIGFPIMVNRNGKTPPEFEYPPKTEFIWYLLLIGVNKCRERLGEPRTSIFHENINTLYEDLEKTGLTGSKQSFIKHFIRMDKGVQESANDRKRKRHDIIASPYYHYRDPFQYGPEVPDYTESLTHRNSAHPGQDRLV